MKKHYLERTFYGLVYGERSFDCNASMVGTSYNTAFTHRGIRPSGSAPVVKDTNGKQFTTSFLTKRIAPRILETKIRAI